jgi:hypothetical protein
MPGLANYCRMRIASSELLDATHDSIIHVGMELTWGHSMSCKNTQQMDNQSRRSKKD